MKGDDIMEVMTETAELSWPVARYLAKDDGESRAWGGELTGACLLASHLTH